MNPPSAAQLAAVDSEPHPTADRAGRRPALRRRFRAARRALSAVQQRSHSQRICRHFLRSPLAWRARRIGAYLAIDGEPDLAPLLARLRRMGKRLTLPVIAPGGRMDFFAYDAGKALVSNIYGIREPAPGARHVPTLALDVVLTPLVAFDGNGNRLGMGGGFYDRHFGPMPAGLRPLLVGVAHELQGASSLPAAAWDVPLDAVLTDAGWRGFSKRSPRSSTRKSR